MKKKQPLTLGKKLLIAVLCVALVIGACYLGYYLARYSFYDAYEQYLSSYEYEEGTELTLGKTALEDYKDYKLVAETDILEMYLNKNTSNVAIRDKRTGVITFAAPDNADDDPVANNKNVNYLKSHLIVTYFNAARTTGTYDSYSMAVEKGQVTYEAIEGGVRVIYTMGDFSNSMGIVPLYISNEKFDEICTFLSESDAKALGNYYRDTSDVAGMRQLITTAISNRRTQSKIQTMLDAAGWTEEIYIEQMALAGVEATVPLSFVIPLEYRLKDDHVEVSIPVSGISEDGGGSLYKIEMLRNFGAADASKSGYLVVPNGDGSLIRFNNGKTNAATYSQYFYGIDPLAADYTVMEAASNASLRLYGICAEDATILATVEDGASLAAVTAGVSGKVNNYNYAYTTFVVRGSETLEMFGTTGNEATLPLVEPFPYDCNLTVRYSFLDAKHTGYNGIANYYRDRLISEGVLTAGENSDSIKFYYDVIAGVEMTEFFLGKQYMSMHAMTTFEEAALISDALAEKGITNQVMNLQGWFNGGYYHDVPNRIYVPWKLGGKSGLEELNAAVAENGGTLYADVAFQKVTFDSKRFNYQAESSKYYGSGYVASFGQVSPVTLRQTASLGYSETMYDLLSPKFLPRYVEAFSERIEKIDVAGISLRDLGSTLHSDKKRTNIIDRDAAQNVVAAQLEILNETGKNMLLSQANDYAWNVADDIINLPLSHNEYVIIDENIPLYEMIVHGTIDYCGKVYNLTDAANDRVQVLTMIEYGAAPHFVFTWAESTEMKYSGLNSNYATTFSVWADKAAQVYSEVNGALSQVTGATVESHEILENGLRKVSYSNGVTVYVNYSAAELTADGIRVPAMGYAVK